MRHKCKVRGPRTRGPLSLPVPAPAATSCCRVCPHLNHLTFCGRCVAPSAPSAPHHCRQELKRKLESAEDSDIVEQGKATLKSVKKERASAAEGGGGAGPGRECATPSPASCSHTRPSKQGGTTHDPHLIPRSPPPRRRCRGHGREAGRGARRGSGRDRGAREALRRGLWRRRRRDPLLPRPLR